MRSSQSPISWFSCGAASYVATKLALEENPDLEVCYIDPGWEHEDNHRFLADAVGLLGVTPTILRHETLRNPAEVFRKKQYISSPFGAPCTSLLKKAVRQQYETGLEVQYFGFHNGEAKRAKRFLASNKEQAHLFRFPLIEKQIGKEECLRILERDGLDPPYMYLAGFKNANCVGCVKGGLGYWKKIRRLFPDRFREVADLVLEIGYALLKQRGEAKRLVDIDWDSVKEEEGLSWECGLLCSDQFSFNF